MTVEALIVGITIAGGAAFLGGLAATLAEFARPGGRRIPLRARYRRGRHHHPRRALAAALHGWRELAAAHALITGGSQPW